MLILWIFYWLNSVLIQVWVTLTMWILWIIEEKNECLFYYQTYFIKKRKQIKMIWAFHQCTRKLKIVVFKFSRMIFAQRVSNSKRVEIFKKKKNTNYNSIKPFIFCIQFVDGIAIFCLLSLLKLAFVFVLCSFFPNFISNTRKPEFSVHFKKESSYFTNGL